MTTRLNGCHNRAPFVAMVTVGMKPAMVMGQLVEREVTIPNFSHGQPCKYTLSDLGRKDAGCVGCKWRGVA